MHRKPFKRSQTSTSSVLKIVHTDVSGLMKMRSIGGANYFVTFIDDYSHYTVVYFLKEKSEVFTKFKEFEAKVTNQMGKTIKVLRLDNGGEYTLKEFEQFLKQKGIKHQVTILKTPEQNGVAE